MPYIFEEDQTTAAEVGYDLHIPEGWTHFDLSPELVRQRQAEVLRQLGAETSTERVEQVNEVFEDLASTLMGAEKLGLLDAAGAFESYDDGFFLGNLTVFRIEQPRGTNFDPLQLISLMHPVAQQTAEETWMRSGTVTIDDIGPCARVEGVVDHQHSEEITIRSVVSHTIAKVPGTRYWLMVCCTSPNVQQTTEVLDLFDAIAGSLTFWSR